MKILVVIFLLLFSCSKDSENNNVGVEHPPKYLYILYYDSLYTEASLIPYSDGSVPTGEIPNGPLVYFYNCSDIPQLCWVKKIDCYSGESAECVVNNDTLYCDTVSTIMNWSKICEE